MALQDAHGVISSGSGEGGPQAAEGPSGSGGAAGCLLLALPEPLLRRVLQRINPLGPLRLSCRGLRDAVDAVWPTHIEVRRRAPVKRAGGSLRPSSSRR